MLNLALVFAATLPAQFPGCGPAHEAALLHVVTEHQPGDTAAELVGDLLSHAASAGFDVAANPLAYDTFFYAGPGMSNPHPFGPLNHPSTSLSPPTRSMLTQIESAISNGLPAAPGHSYASASPLIESQLQTISNGLPLVSAYEQTMVICALDNAWTQLFIVRELEQSMNASGTPLIYADWNDFVRRGVRGTIAAVAQSGVNGSESAGQDDMTAMASTLSSVAWSSHQGPFAIWTGYGWEWEDDFEKVFKQSVKESLERLEEILEPRQVEGPISGEVPPPWNGEG
ncbi:MAG: hypothetical protein AAFU79_29940 [Myxococcota bacterium]